MGTVSCQCSAAHHSSLAGGSWSSLGISRTPENCRRSWDEEYPRCPPTGTSSASCPWKQPNPIPRDSGQGSSLPPPLGSGAEEGCSSPPGPLHCLAPSTAVLHAAVSNAVQPAAPKTAPDSTCTGEHPCWVLRSHQLITPLPGHPSSPASAWEPEQKRSLPPDTQEWSCCVGTQHPPAEWPSLFRHPVPHIHMGSKGTPQNY